MYINISNRPQILPNSSNCGRTPYPPLSIIRQRATNIDLSQMRDKFKKISTNELINEPNITLQRMYALGDLIMLVPVVRYLQKLKNNTIYIATTDRIYRQINGMFPDIRFITIDAYEPFHHGPCIVLDSILEHDHSLENDEHNYHRSEIFARHLELYENFKLEWSGVMTNKPTYFTKDDNVIGIQLRGSGPIKTLPSDYIKLLVNRIISEGYKVFLIDGNKNNGFDGEGIYNLCGKLSPVEVVQHLRECKCVICTDSGVLWLAHVAECPVLAYLGATRESERLNHHPLYPKQVKAVQLAESIGCKPCFETREHNDCGNGYFHCMRDFDYDIILNESISKIKSIIGV